jgi:eukaryotic-like serine/threonine-protein kinase
VPEVEALKIGVQICEALIYLHEQDPAVTHRDIKPGNIKITPERTAVLVDFGLVKLLRDQQVTTTAARAMTPGYSPPEQYGDASTDQRSDIFSLGATLYAALGGFLPADSLARSTGKDELTPLRSYNPQVSWQTATAIEKALALRFEERWQTAREFKAALQQALEALPAGERSSSRLVQPSTTQIEGSGEAQGIGQSLVASIRRLDPVWILFGSTLLLLAIMLGVSLAWPDDVQRILAGMVEDATPTNSINTPTGDQTPGFVQTAEEEMTATIDSTSPVVDPIDPSGMTPSPTPLGGGGGMLAFVSERTGQPQIWLLDLFSRKVTQLTDLTDGACQPDWSPDGMRIVFTAPCPTKRSRYPGSSLYIIDLATQALAPLTVSLEGDFDPAWSPDGEWIAYTSLINGQMQLMKTSLGGSEVIRLSDGSYDDFDAAWSPEGEQLAFIRIRSVNQVWLMGADGEDPVQFTRSGLIDNSNPAWHPDKDVILFSQVLGLGSPSKQLFGMRLEDLGESEEYPILPSSRLNYIPLMDNVDVSDDGFWLAFDYWYFDVLSDVTLMAFPGGTLIQMTEHPAMDYDPNWRPQP